RRDRPLRREVHRRRDLIEVGSELHADERPPESSARDGEPRAAEALPKPEVGPRRHARSDVRDRLQLLPRPDLPEGGHPAGPGADQPTVAIAVLDDGVAPARAVARKAAGPSPGRIAPTDTAGVVLD